jgi:hypothetical protein
MQAETLEKAYSLEDFVADTRRSLKSNPGPDGVEEVRQHLEQLLRNPNLLRDHLSDSPWHHCIHHDQRLMSMSGAGRESRRRGYDHGMLGGLWPVYVTDMRSQRAWTTAAKRLPISGGTRVKLVQDTPLRCSAAYSLHRLRSEAFSARHR